MHPVIRRGLVGRLQHLADVVERGRGADVAAQDGEVLVAGDVGDLALLDAGGRGRGRVAGAQRVPGEAASGGTPAAWARRLTISATDWSESRRSVSVSPRRICRNTGPRWIAAASSHAWSARTAHLSLARAYGTATWAPACSWSVLDLRIMTFSPRAGSKLEVLDVERDELRAAQRGGEPEQQQRPVALAGERGGVDRLEQPRERVELERRGLAQRAGAVLAADPRHDRGDGAGVARVGVILGAVRGGDRRRAAPDRDRPEPAVGLGGQERRDASPACAGIATSAARGAPGREQRQSLLIRAAGRRRERARRRSARRARARARTLPPARRRTGCWKGPVGHG